MRKANSASKDDEKPKKSTTFLDEAKDPITKPPYEGVWDSIFRRMCEINYGCCCCASLRTGTLIFAWGFVFWFFLELIGSVFFACVNNSWIDVDFLLAKNDTITAFHKLDPFVYTVMSFIEFCLSAILLAGVFNESNMRFNYIRTFVQSFIILIIIGVMYEAAKFVAYVSLGEENEIRIYGSLLFCVFLQGLYGWGTIVVKCYYVEVVV